MFPEVFTPEVIAALIVDSPIVLFGMFAVYSLKSVLIKALEAIVSMARTIREISLSQSRALQDATVTAPDLNQLAETGLD
ncbi:MAG: hypothetical protein AAFN66_05390 [Pseudomonadota bacterium]